jgi:hypothetical protein
MTDVDHPAYYGGDENPYEAIKVIEAWGLGFRLGNAVKYIGRPQKGAHLEDLRKARWYLDREIGALEAEAAEREERAAASLNFPGRLHGDGGETPGIYDQMTAAGEAWAGVLPETAPLKAVSAGDTVPVQAHEVFPSVNSTWTWESGTPDECRVQVEQVTKTRGKRSVKCLILQVNNADEQKRVGDTYDVPPERFWEAVLPRLEAKDRA